MHKNTLWFTVSPRLPLAEVPNAVERFHEKHPGKRVVVRVVTEDGTVRMVRPCACERCTSVPP